MRNPKPADENGALAAFESPILTPTRRPFAEANGATAHGTNARFSQWVIAVGTVSVVAVTATVLNVAFNDPEPDKLVASSRSKAAVTNVRPSIDFGRGPLETSFHTANSATAQIGGSPSKRLEPQMPAAVVSTQELTATLKEMPSNVKDRQAPQSLSKFSLAATSANARSETSSSPEGPILTGTRLATPNLIATNEAAERHAVQFGGLATSEATAWTSFATPIQRPTGSRQTTTAGAIPDLRVPHLERDAEDFNDYPTTLGSLANIEMVADGPMPTAPVADDADMDDVLLLDVELADAKIARIFPSDSASAAEKIEFLPLSIDAQAISYPASLEEALQLEAPRRISSNEESVQEIVSNQASGAFPDTISLAAANAPVAELAALVRDPSAIELASALPVPSAQVAYAEEVSNTLAAQVQVGGADVGPLPLHFSTDALVSVRLADLISLFEDRMDRPLFVWLKSSSSANEYVTFDTLRAAGIDAQYDAGTQQLELSIVDDQAS